MISLFLFLKVLMSLINQTWTKKIGNELQDLLKISQMLLERNKCSYIKNDLFLKTFGFTRKSGGS